MSSDTTKQDNGLSYADAGVDIDAGNELVKKIGPAIKSTARTGSNPELGGFGGLFDLAATGFKDPLLVAANDGVGTKLKIAIETGNHHTVGIDLVAMCVNDLIVQGAEPLFFLDYFSTGKLDVYQAATVVDSIAEGCRRAGAALIGGETAEMPGMYAKNDYDLAGFSVGAVERGAILPSAEISEGNVLLGLASSGVHSNGFSLVRKVMENAGVTWGDEPPFNDKTTLGEVFLEPTRIYVQPLLAALRGTGGINGLVHITGGGFVENIPRILPEGLSARINLSAITPHPIFGWLAEKGGISELEMLRTFNCGIGMIVVADPKKADALSKALTADGETVVELGQLEKGDNSVSFDGKLAF